MASKLDRQSVRLVVGSLLLLIAIAFFGHSDLLDARFYYTGEFAQVFFALLSPGEAQAYVRGAILDLVFIHFFTSLIWHEFTKILGFSSLRWVALAPGYFDAIETVSILAILISGFIPTSLDWLGFATAAKWTTAIAVALWWLLLLFRRRYAKSRV